MGSTTNGLQYSEINVEIEGGGVIPVVRVVTKANLDACLSSNDNIGKTDAQKKEIILFEINKNLELLFGVDRQSHKILSHDFKFGRPVSVYGIDIETSDIGSQQRRQDHGGIRFFEPGLGGYGAGNQHSLTLNMAVKELADRIGLAYTTDLTNKNKNTFK